MASKSTTTVLSPFASMAVSMAASGVAHVLHHPLYTLKTHMQTEDFSFNRFVRQIQRNPVRFLYSGVIARTIGIMPEKMFKMQAWIVTNRMLENHLDLAGFPKWIIAGTVAGMATSLVACPSELLMVQAMTQGRRFVDIVRERGVLGIYLGASATLYRDIGFNCAFFTLRNWGVHFHEEYYGPCSSSLRFVIGAVAGCLGSIVANPYDVIKTRLQSVSTGAEKLGCHETMMIVARNEGVLRLMSGLGPRFIMIPSTMSLFYVLHEKLEAVVEKLIQLPATENKM